MGARSRNVDRPSPAGRHAASPTAGTAHQQRQHTWRRLLTLGNVIRVRHSRRYRRRTPAMVRRIAGLANRHLRVTSGGRIRVGLENGIARSPKRATSGGGGAGSRKLPRRAPGHASCIHVIKVDLLQPEFPVPIASNRSADGELPVQTTDAQAAIDAKRLSSPSTTQHLGRRRVPSEWKFPPASAIARGDVHQSATASGAVCAGSNPAGGTAATPGSVAEAARGAARHTRAWAVDALAVVASVVGRLSFEPRHQTPLVSEVQAAPWGVSWPCTSTAVTAALTPTTADGGGHQQSVTATTPAKRKAS